MILHASGPRVVRFCSGVFLTKFTPCVDEDQFLINLQNIYKSQRYRALECAITIKSSFLG
jgi:hypothetical protein